ncbi:unnamed protein product [Nippostrongylus brasiliensis]|uniref:Phosphoribosylpyrophosphate synthetase n=1 Tax=Nippostrongylus brasiliensis TaxID=27835 RepID=A0A0N4XFZ8_NIPBR|nr:unnamed protein product [Nippostrongylus brasiliensis]
MFLSTVTVGKKDIADFCERQGIEYSAAALPRNGHKDVEQLETEASCFDDSQLPVSFSAYGIDVPAQHFSYA